MTPPKTEQVTVILYKVEQRTTAPKDRLEAMIENFKFELELQFGSSIAIEVVATRPEALGAQELFHAHGS